MAPLTNLLSQGDRAKKWHISSRICEKMDDSDTGGKDRSSKKEHLITNSIVDPSTLVENSMKQETLVNEMEAESSLKVPANLLKVDSSLSEYSSS